ncbi:MAG TPA: amino acid adenylation domain-containing protein, partial [Thioploca sp.]|nr:amino acid adenylation domain-containing protein [Thioploca sp.]
EERYEVKVSRTVLKTSLYWKLYRLSLTLFDATTITRMVGHFKTLLEGIVVNPKQHVFKLPLLTEEERQRLLVEWNDTATDYPQDKCIHQLFEAQVEKNPDAVAVVFEDQQLSYQELNTRANQLAHHLQTLGVKPEVLVGICVERSLEMIIGLLGILKAGGAYVPLDPKYPQARLAFMLEDAQVQTLVTQQPLLATFTKHKLPSIVCLDTDWQAAISLESEENPKGLATPENIAYVIYTSGSTGKPKGVMVAHQGLCNLATVQSHIFNLPQGNHVLQFASLNFDSSVWEIVMALLSGSVLYLETRNALLPSSSLVQLLREQAITIITLPPSALAVLPVEELPALHTIIVAGEACPAELAVRWAPGRLFFNGYGPTETTVGATLGEIRGQIDSNLKLPIGYPFANTQVYVLDANLQPVPIGIPGELYIGGVGLARGYLNRPVLTAEKFIPNPFSNDPVARLYKTGDLVRYLSDGNIEYLGRIHHQDKIRGFRIELEEIEAVLNQDSTVWEAAVIAREDEPGNKRLVAYIVSKLILERLPIQSVCVAEFGDEPPITLNTEDISYKGVGLVGVPPTCQADQNVRLRLQLPDETEELCLKGRVAWCQDQRAGVQFTLTSAEQTQLDKRIENLFETQGFMKVIQRTSTAHLRDVLKEKLPDYMVPASFVFLSAMPLTPNGKIDRKALPNPQALRLDDEASYIAPETEIEHQIATVWQSVLQINKVGIHDNFFDLGGNSLLIIQVQNKLVEVLNKEVPVVAFFQYPTISALAHYLADSHHEPATFKATYDHAHKAKEARHRHHKHHKK